MKIPIEFFCAVLLLSGCLNQPGKSPSGENRKTITQTVLAMQGTVSGTENPSPANRASPSVTPTATIGKIPTASASSPTEESTVTLAFVGDIMLGRSLAVRITQGQGNAIFESVEPVLQSADWTVGNLECAMGEGGKPAQKSYTFLAPPAAASLLGNAGFDLLALANNHSLDYGGDVFRQTQDHLMENGMQFVGGGSDAARARAPVERVIRGLRVAFLAYAEVPVEAGGFDARTWIAGVSSPGISWVDEGNIPSDLRSLRTRADFIVVLFHFGTEGSASPNDRQTTLAHLAVDQGADLVVGSHPHVLQKEENYKGRWIFYSIGNFVFDGYSGMSNRSAILWISVARDASVSYSLYPVIIVDGIPVLGNQ